ncbi:MAG: ribose-phosphate pyrophosphokinase [Lachnospiraceae bacterium]|nr:ribose-phosphate pyrophosphokinase [Lachnospiraceae bacterium]MBR4144397.1 ribose-phosphate pyrophosphokinase [Lachnospiraceae bacterium]MBR4781177.1 ribose-phosphate pyrophosphokinase [Lachnospiraceae bacterium]MBR6475894.1 ribose-phosphate pyrophosphokinase [Lachnospiraceae bacterium]
MSPQSEFLETIPVGKLGIIALKSSEELGKKINDYLVQWRDQRDNEHTSTIAFSGYQRDTFLINSVCPRFGTGEGKAVINESVRGYDLYILVDVTNYSLQYTVRGQKNHMSPDDHFQDLKRIIGAVGGKARRITVIMPYLYESRQDKRTARESLDCAQALEELYNMGVDSVITFDAHEPKVQNAIPLKTFETIKPTYQFIKALLNNVPDIQMTPDKMMVVSPDEGAMGRSIYFGTALGLDISMFYKRRDYTRVVDGRNPIVAHEYLGADLKGKDVVILDDMISSGDSMLEVGRELKKRGAGRIFFCATFGLFTEGLARFDEAYKEGIFDRVVTTNLIYQTPELLQREYYINADMSKYIALIIDTLNHDFSISEFLDPTDRIHKIIEKHNQNR